jgi:hypothetical protein
MRRAAIKRRFIIHPVQWDAASAFGPTRPCDWTDPADVVFHSVTYKSQSVCVSTLSAGCFFMHARKISSLPMPRALFPFLSLFRLIYHLRRPRYLHAKSVHTRESARCYTPLPADLWRKLRFNFAADKINRGIGC